MSARPGLIWAAGPQEMNAGGFALDLDPFISSSELIQHHGDIVTTVQRLVIFEFPIKILVPLVFSCGTLSPDQPRPLCRHAASFCLQHVIRKRGGYCRSSEYRQLFTFTSTGNLSNVYSMNLSTRSPQGLHPLKGQL